MTSRVKVLLIEESSGQSGLEEEWAVGEHTLDIAHGACFTTALGQLAMGGIGAVLLDLQMRESCGLEMFRRIRRQAPLVPILILSAEGEEPLALQALREGAWDYFVKGQVEKHFLLRALRYAIEYSRKEEVLRESESRYKQLLESITDYIYSVRVEDGRPIETTHGPGCLAVTGYATVEFMSDPYLWYRIVHEDDQHAVLKQARAVLQGNPFPLEHRIRHKSGAVRWIRNTVVIRRDEVGRIVAYDGLINDITPRKFAEESLRASEERYRLLFEGNLAGILRTTIDGRILECNESFARILGYDSPDEVREHSAWEMHFDHADRERLVNLLQARGSLSNHEIRLQRRNGSPVWALANVVLVQEDEGTPVIHGTIFDVTSRVRAMEALRTSEALYQSLVESIPLGVFRKDRTGRFVFANHRFCDSLGMSLDQLLGKTDHDCYPRELAEKYRCDDMHVLSTGTLFEDTEIHQKPGADRAYVKIVKTPVFGPDNAIIGTQGIFWDVTEQRWAEEQKGQMSIARAIQKKLFPPFPPQVRGFEIGGASYPAEATGGDYFDYITLHDGSVGLVLGDVSGHGFGPALLGAVTHACLRTMALMRLEIDPDLMLTTGNSLIYEDTGGEPFVTLFFGLLDPVSRTLRYCSAGHPAGIVLAASGEVRSRLDTTGPALGIFPEATFPTSTPVSLESGDVVLLVSDGIPDAMAPDGSTFGMARALEVVRGNLHLSAQEIVQVLCGTARDFCKATPQHDDITAVVIKENGTTASHAR